MKTYRIEGYIDEHYFKKIEKYLPDEQGYKTVKKIINAFKQQQDKFADSVPDAGQFNRIEEMAAELDEITSRYASSTELYALAKLSQAELWLEAGCSVLSIDLTGKANTSKWEESNLSKLNSVTASACLQQYVKLKEIQSEIGTNANSQKLNAMIDNTLMQYNYLVTKSYMAHPDQVTAIYHKMVSNVLIGTQLSEAYDQTRSKQYFQSATFVANQLPDPSSETEIDTIRQLSNLEQQFDELNIDSTLTGELMQVLRTRSASANSVLKNKEDHQPLKYFRINHIHNRQIKRALLHSYHF